MTDQNKQRLKELVQRSCDSKEVADETTKIIDAEVTLTGKMAILYFLWTYDDVFNSSFFEGYLDLRPELSDWIATMLYEQKSSIDGYRQLGEEWMGEMGSPKKEINVYIPTIKNDEVVKEKTKVINENLLGKVKRDPELLLKTAKEIIDSHFQLSPITKEILTLALRST